MRLLFYYIIICTNLAYAQVEVTNNFESLLESSTTYRNYGFYEKSCQKLQLAEVFVGNNTVYKIRHLNEKADLSLIIPPQIIPCVKPASCICQLHSDAQPEQLLQQAETLARKIDEPLLLAQVFNKQGNMLTISSSSKKSKESKKFKEKALQKYQDSIEYAEQVNNSLLIAKARINLAKVTFLLHAKKPTGFKAEKINLVIKELQTALEITKKLPASHDKAFGLLALGKLASQLLQIAKQKKLHEQQINLQNIALLALHTAQETAEKIQDNIALSYAYGNLGELYYNTKSYPEALSLTRKALFLAQQADFLPDKMLLPELVYRWYWQLGRVFKEIKQPEEAIKMYLSAVETLQPIRQSLANTGYCDNRLQLIGKEGFYNSLAPLYYELMDLLITQHNKLPRDSSKYLLELLYTLERFKIAEFQDYYGDKCLAVLQSGKFVEKLDKFIDEQKNSKTAILYPILLAEPQNQTQLLLSLPNGLHLIPLEVPYQTIKKTINFFPNTLQSGTSNNYLEYAKPLYDWLIKPIEDKLTQIDTLVIVPDAISRKIPFAAFHDGKNFLIENYAVAVTQGLALTSLKPIDIKADNKSNVFLGGVSDAIDIKSKNLLDGVPDVIKKFPPLPQAKSEVDEIEKEYYPRPQSKILFNSEFSKAQFELEIKKNLYSIVHIASHGKFETDSSKNYFITYGDEITLDRLEELIKSNTSNVAVELLTLSACQTAVGSNRAALGLAGVAVKTGVKSALANLWEVDDEAAYKLIIYFYDQLKQRQHSDIAQALQQAQIKLLKEKPHPHYWAPLVLVGNWM